MAQVSGGKLYRRLLAEVKPYWGAFVLAIVGNILYGAVDAGLVKLLEPLLNEGFVARNQNFIQWIPAIVLGIFLIRGIATFLSTYFMGWVGRKVVMNFRQKIFDHLLGLPTSFYDKRSSGELLSKITFNVEQVADASTDAITVIVRELCTAIGLLVVMLSISWQLTLLFLITLPIMALIMHWFSKRLRQVSRGVQHSMGSVTHVAEEAIEGQQVIKAFGGEKRLRESFFEMTQTNRHQEMKHITTTAVSIPIIQMIGACALAATVYLATSSTVHSQGITPGAFAAMISSMLLILKPIKQLTKVNSTIQRGIAGAASIFELLDEKLESDTGTRTMKSCQGQVSFDNVSFRYETQGAGTPPVLDAVSFSIQPGEVVALVGRSGSGKSTLASLVPRFYDCEGHIYLDGIDTHELTLNSLRSHIAIVSQHITLFNDTIGNNIRFGRPEASDDELVAAARSAYLHEFIESLPEGYNTPIGENGLRLSGGQRQRIAIARAIIRQAPLLILDEATSALDSESERYIQSALDSLMEKCTTLVIAHRLSTIEHADKILVLDRGRIVEQGSHQALIKANGAYAQLRQLQYQDVDIVEINVT